MPHRKDNGVVNLKKSKGVMGSRMNPRMGGALGAKCLGIAYIHTC